MKREDLLKVAKPILFNTEMVRAILDGRKTQTRRVIKPRKKKAMGFYVTKYADGTVSGVYDYDENESMFDNPQPLPYNPDDILYVRETWAWCPCWHCGYDMNEKTANDKCFNSAAHRIYNKKRAEYGCCEYKAGNLSEVSDFDGKWKPSIHMPKEAARIFLKVTDVRVERLKDITVQDCIKEGVNEYHLREIGGEFVRGIFNEIWDSTINKADRDKYGWEANPYVWVIAFERIGGRQ